MMIILHCIPENVYNKYQAENLIYSWMKISANKLGWRENKGSRGEVPVRFFVNTPSDSQKTWETPFYVSLLFDKDLSEAAFS